MAANANAMSVAANANLNIFAARVELNRGGGADRGM